MRPSSPPRRRAYRLSLALALLPSTGCVESSPSPGPEADAAAQAPAVSVPPSPRPVVVDFGPCTSTRADAQAQGSILCGFDPEREFRLWVRPDGVEPPAVLVDGRRLPTRALEPVDEHSEGLGLTLPEDARSLAVVWSAQERWTLSLRAQGRAEGRPDPGGALEALGRFVERISGAGLGEDWDRELRELDTQLDRQGWLEQRVGLHTAVAHMLAREHRFDDALGVLERVEPLARRSPHLQALLAYSRGQVQWRRGQADEALADLRAASLHAVRVDEPLVGYAALPMYAELLAELGYVDAALRWSQRGLELVREHGTPCDLASTLRTAAWVHLLLQRQGSSNHDPEPMLREALALFERDGECPSADRRGGTRLSLATVALRQGRPGEALEVLGPASASPMTPGERVRALDVEIAARLALGRDRASLEPAFESLRAAVERDGTLEARWHLAVRQGQWLEATGERDAALGAYREAEGHLDTMARLAGLGVGRGAVGIIHRESSERLVDALRAMGRVEEALCVARQAEARQIQSASLSPSLPPRQRAFLEHRGRALVREQARHDELLRLQHELPASELATLRAKVAEQQRRLVREADQLLVAIGHHVGRPACEALHQPEPGELLLGLFPRGEGWLLFARDERETTVQALELRELDLASARARLSELLLRPVADQLHRARRVRVHAAGQARRIDVGLLPWEGKPLIAHMPVVHGIDVVAPEPDRPADDPPRAVLVADPTGSLPEADQEVRHAVASLGGMGWAVQSIARPEARPHHVAQRMAGATLLHYAGHAQHDDRRDPRWWPPYAGGTPSWPASLQLAEGTRLAAPDILVQSGRVPSRVILSGCRTGALDASTTGMSLAVAFLVAGAQEVIASSTDTADMEASQIVRALYDHLDTTGPDPWSLGDAFARAQARRLEAGQPAGHYRVWVR